MKRVAGPDRIHIGLESGCEDVLRFMEKGVSGDAHVAAGIRVLDTDGEIGLEKMIREMVDPYVKHHGGYLMPFLYQSCQQSYSNTFIQWLIF